MSRPKKDAEPHRRRPAKALTSPAPGLTWRLSRIVGDSACRRRLSQTSDARGLHAGIEQTQPLRNSPSALSLDFFSARRDSVNRQPANHSGEGRNLPRQIVSVPCIKQPPDNPRQSPLPKRISHDDQPKQFAERSRSEALCRNQRNKHVIRPHRKSENECKRPCRRRSACHSEQKHRRAH